MVQIPKQFIAPALLDTSTPTVGTVGANVKFIPKQFTLANISANARLVYVTMAGGAMSQVTVPANTTLIYYPALNHILNAGETISVLADAAAAVRIMVSGIEQTL